MPTGTVTWPFDVSLGTAEVLLEDHEGWKMTRGFSQISSPRLDHVRRDCSRPSTERFHPMTRLARAFLLAALAACALPALADAAPATTRGIIVQRDAATGTVVIASPSGVLHRVTVASPAHLQMGTLVRVRGSKIKVLGHARSAKVHGLVMRSSRHSYALAGNGAVVGVTTPTPPSPDSRSRRRCRSLPPSSPMMTATSRSPTPAHRPPSSTEPSSRRMPRR